MASEDWKECYEIPEPHGILEAVMRLSGKYRIVIQLYYFKDYSAKEIGSTLYLSASRVTSRLGRARKMLKEIWEGADLDG